MVSPAACRPFLARLTRLLGLDGPTWAIETKSFRNSLVHFIAMERIQTAWFSTAGRIIRDRQDHTGSQTGSRLAFVWRRSNPPIIGFICQHFPHRDQPSCSILLPPYGKLASCASNLTFASQLGLFASHHHTPVKDGSATTSASSTAPTDVLPLQLEQV